MQKFLVKGKPVPQGSMKFIKPGVMIHSRAADLALWRADIARNAELNGYKPVSGAVKVEIDFLFIRPKSSKRVFPSVTPDLDKLIRAVLDGLTGVAYEDDCQVILIQATKTYGRYVGAWIGVEQVFDEVA
jgi:crossover junction endodeoxyribonuclease RusA|tara:strand:+ start:4607 stop:4996 length:390 start_codon:yes stop_codon:yes gene_type:complete